MATDDAEDTLRESPWAKAVHRAVETEIRKLTGDLCEALVNRLAPIFRGELEVERTERIRVERILFERLELLENRVDRLTRSTEPAPPPSIPPMGGE